MKNAITQADFFRKISARKMARLRHKNTHTAQTDKNANVHFTLENID